MSASNQERLLDLLSDRALEGLAADELVELSALMGGANDESFDRAAAAVALATIDADEPLPSHLAAKIEADAMRVLPVTLGGKTPSLVRASPRRDVVRFAGWVAAAAPAWGPSAIAELDVSRRIKIVENRLDTAP